MGSGSRSGNQLLAVIALVCAIGGLVLAAGALTPLASDSPASGIFGGATEGQTAGETATPSAAAAGGTGSGSSLPSSGLNSDLVSRLASNPLVGGVISNLLDGSAGGQSRSDVDDSSMDDTDETGDTGAQSDGSGEMDSTDGSDETGSTDGTGETGSTDGSDGTGATDGSDGTGSTDGSDSTDGSSGTETSDGGDETDSSSGDADRGQSTSEQEVGGTDGQASAAQDEDRSDASADESGGDGESDPKSDADDGDDSSLTDSVPELSDRAVTAGLVAIAALVVGYVFYTREDPIGTLLSIPGRLVSLALGAVVACSQALERALAALRGLSSIAELPGLVLAAISDAIRSARTRVREFGSSVSTSLFGSAAGADGTDAAVDTHTSARERIRQAFESVIDASPMYRTRVATATPADVARSATDAGAPDEPVETITHSFRDVEYGDRDPDAYLERTATAHDQLREAIESTDEDDVDGSDSSATTETGTEAGAGTGTETKAEMGADAGGDSDE